jgi:hypothetical protein
MWTLRSLAVQPAVSTGIGRAHARSCDAVDTLPASHQRSSPSSHRSALALNECRSSVHVPGALITKPEDDEVILVRPGKRYFPQSIIVEFIERL